MTATSLLSTHFHGEQGTASFLDIRSRVPLWTSNGTSQELVVQAPETVNCFLLLKGNLYVNLFIRPNQRSSLRLYIHTLAKSRSLAQDLTLNC